jgi:sec-independent protein translocase protein TatB
MFGIGPQELVIVALIALVVLGPRRLPQMARDLGSFVREARSSLDEFREELDSEEVDEVRRGAEARKKEGVRSKDLHTRGEKL